ncbi:MAG: lipoyl synthase [candidate division WOR-3 bacterium]|uniref:Lipoyl synthase n=1 Tax=candidate division WOR-3 bacterium TaxID=2052148 RepID=A0A7C1SWC2_UNCW3|nr:lipoyl synthase [candidate division WOR-3 bacterium]
MRKPEWLRFRLPAGPEFIRVNQVLRKYNLNTVCSSARCPNLAECWNRGTATVLLLGNTCTRHCRFCAVTTGNPHGQVDNSEPERVADAILELGLKYVVLTSVDRDDLPDLGAGIFTRTVQLLKKSNPGIAVEVLVPDFQGKRELIQQVLDAGPDVFAHNLETVERLTPAVRDRRADYRLSLSALQLAKRLAPAIRTKSGLMVGLGETEEEVIQTLTDLKSAGCDIVTIGQYLQPDRRCLPVARYYTREELQKLSAHARTIGIPRTIAAPLVRSSYLAEELLKTDINPVPPQI